MKNIFIFLVLISCCTCFSQASYTVCATAPLTLTAPIVPSLTAQSYSLNPGGSVSSTNVFTVFPASNTIYTLYTTGTNSNSAQVTIISTSSVEVVSMVFNISSPQNFTLGCLTKSLAIINVSTVTISPPGTTVSYTYIPPGGSTVLPSGSFGNGSFSLTVPGTYSYVARTNYCDTYGVFSIISNTVAPVLDSISPVNRVLSCKSPSVILKAHSNTPNVSYYWFFPGVPGVVPTQTYAVMSNSAAPSLSLVSNYTTMIMDNSSLCRTSSIIPIYQNLYPPIARIASPQIKNCLEMNVIFTNQSISGIPPNVFPVMLPVIVQMWVSPQTVTASGTTYTPLVAGTYSMYVVDLNNGCTSLSTATVEICERVAESEELKMEIFANPATDRLYIKSEGVVNLQLCNIEGREFIKSESVTDEVLKMEDLSPGFYVLKLQSATATKTIKIVKE